LKGKEQGAGTVIHHKELDYRISKERTSREQMSTDGLKADGWKGHADR
jgi:hypothetical protein